MTIRQPTHLARNDLDDMIRKAYTEQAKQTRAALEVSYGLAGPYLTLDGKKVDYFRAAEYLRDF